MDTIKDLLWLLLTLTTISVAILGYINTKKALSTPLRSEVIRRQADEIVKLLDFLGIQDNKLIHEIHYPFQLKKNMLFRVIQLAETNLPIEAIQIVEDARISEDPGCDVDAYFFIINLGELSIRHPDLSLLITDFNQECDSESIDSDNEGKHGWGESREIATEKLIPMLNLECPINDQVLKQLEYFANNTLLPKNILSQMSALRDEIYNTLLGGLSKHVMMIDSDIENYFKCHNSDTWMEINLDKRANKYLDDIKDYTPIIREIKAQIRNYLKIDQPWE